jgi:hypothetical protein
MRCHRRHYYYYVIFHYMRCHHRHYYYVIFHYMRCHRRHYYYYVILVVLETKVFPESRCVYYSKDNKSTFIFLPDADEH